MQNAFTLVASEMSVKRRVREREKLSLRRAVAHLTRSGIRRTAIDPAAPDSLCEFSLRVRKNVTCEAITMCAARKRINQNATPAER